MELVRKNIFSIVCGVIAVLCVVAVFVWPVPGAFASLQAELESSKKTFNDLNAVRTAQRSLPVLDPDQPEAEPLPYFPTNEVVNVGVAAVKRRQQLANQVYESVLNLNRRTPLVEGSLPTPRIDGLRFNFRDLYLTRMAVNGPRLSPESIVQSVLQGAAPPSPEDIERASARRRAQIEAEAIRDAQGNILNEQEIQSRLVAEIASLPQQMQQEAARTAKVYVEPTAFSVHPAILRAFETQVAPDPVSIFNAQVGLWVHQDIASAIAAINESAPNVREAKVKHLVRINFPESPFPGYQGGGRNDDVSAEVTLPIDKAVELPTDSTSPTGRRSNPMYDVVRFDLTLRCEAMAVPEVLAELSRNRLITVYHVVYVEPVNVAQQFSNGFIYSSETHAAPVVEIKMECEVLFLREWLAPLMPPEVQRQLAAVSAAAS